MRSTSDATGPADRRHTARRARWRRVGRSTELGLLVLAACITVGAWVLASLGETASLPARTWAFLAAVVGLSLAAHVAARVCAPSADQQILPLVAFLNGLGFVVVSRLDANLAGLQATWTALGVAAYRRRLPGRPSRVRARPGISPAPASGGGTPPASR